MFVYLFTQICSFKNSAAFAQRRIESHLIIVLSLSVKGFYNGGMISRLLGKKNSPFFVRVVF